MNFKYFTTPLQEVGLGWKRLCETAGCLDGGEGGIRLFEEMERC